MSENLPNSPGNENPELIKEKKGLLERLIEHPFYLILAVAFVVYVQTFFFEYTNYDDQHLLYANDYQTEKLNDIGTAISSPYLYSTYYRPLVNLSFYLDAQIAGESAFMHHFTNFILHCIAASLVFVLFHRLGFKRIQALLASLVFAVHPLLINAEVWIVGRGDILVAIFGIASFLAFKKMMEKDDNIYLVYHLLFLLLAVFSKESALLLPLIFGMYWFYNYKDKKVSTFRLFMIFFPWVALIIIIPVIKMALDIQLTDPNFDIINIFFNLQAIPETIFKAILPYKHDAVSIYNPVSVSVGTAMIIALAVLAILKKQDINKPNIKFGVLLFLIPLVPAMFVSGLYVDLGVYQLEYDYIDSRSYLPLIGFLIVVFTLIPSRFFAEGKKTPVLIFSIIILVFSVLNIIQSRQYKDAAAFGMSITGDSEQFAVPDLSPEEAQKLLDEAMEMGRAGEIDSAIVRFDRVMKIDTANFKLFANRGLLKVRKRDFEGAVYDFTKVIEYRSDDYMAYFQRGAAYLELSDTKAALKDFDKVVELRPDDAPGYFQRGSARLDLLDFDNAVEDFSFVIGKNPDDFIAYAQRGLARYETKDYKGALEDCNKLLELNPDYLNGYVQRGLVKIKLNKKSSACEDFSKAAALGSAEANNLINEYCN